MSGDLWHMMTKVDTTQLLEKKIYRSYKFWPIKSFDLLLVSIEIHLFQSWLKGVANSLFNNEQLCSQLVQSIKQLLQRSLTIYFKLWSQEILLQGILATLWTARMWTTAFRYQEEASSTGVAGFTINCHRHLLKRISSRNSGKVQKNESRPTFLFILLEMQPQSSDHHFYFYL